MNNLGSKYLALCFSLVDFHLKSEVIDAFLVVLTGSVAYIYKRDPLRESVRLRALNRALLNRSLHIDITLFHCHNGDTYWLFASEYVCPRKQKFDRLSPPAKQRNFHTKCRFRDWQWRNANLAVCALGAYDRNHQHTISFSLTIILFSAFIFHFVSRFHFALFTFMLFVYAFSNNPCIISLCPHYNLNNFI